MQSVPDRQRIGQPAPKKVTYRAYRAFRALLFGKLGTPTLTPVSGQIRATLTISARRSRIAGPIVSANSVAALVILPDPFSEREAFEI